VSFSLFDYLPPWVEWIADWRIMRAVDLSGRSSLSLAARAVQPYDNTYDNWSGNRRKSRTLADAWIAQNALILKAKSAISSASYGRAVLHFFCFACKGSGVRVSSSPPYSKPAPARDAGFLAIENPRGTRRFFRTSVAFQLVKELVRRIRSRDASRRNIHVSLALHFLPALRPKPSLSSIDSVLRDQFDASGFKAAKSNRW